MITSNTPFTRRFRLVLAAIIIAALSIGSVQLASAQPQRAGKAHKLKVRMINPFYQGIAVKPSKTTYFNWQKQQRLTLSGLAWQSWGGSRAMAVGQNNDGDQVDVALSARRKCGMPKFRFYTRMVVSGESSPLQCKVQVLSATDIGEAAEDVYSLPKLNARYDISIPPQSATITHAVWRGFGKSTIKGRGVASAWWSLYDFRWVPALTQIRE